jgi:hypothetical protein
VSFANSHAGFPRLTPADSVVDASDINVESLMAAASERYSALLIADRDPATLDRLVGTTLPHVKANNRPFFIVYQLKEAPGQTGRRAGWFPRVVRKRMHSFCSVQHFANRCCLNPESWGMDCKSWLMICATWGVARGSGARSYDPYSI